MGLTRLGLTLILCEDFIFISLSGGVPMRLTLRSFCLFLAAWAACAQQNRITGTIDTTRTAVLVGNRSSRAMPQYDRGPVDSGQLIDGITLVFKRSASQQSALEQLLAEQQDPTSPNYHNWLTPEQFADRFGLSASDVAKVTDWLRSQGFSVAYESRSRTYVRSEERRVGKEC